MDILNQNLAKMEPIRRKQSILEFSGVLAITLFLRHCPDKLERLILATSPGPNVIKLFVSVNYVFL
jgi:hypothetical protein